MLDAAQRLDDTTFSYPPYNIEKLSDDDYRITMAVAGFAESDLDITVQDHSLVITGKANRDESQVQYLHRGIAGRSFERRFELADFIRVEGAALVNGLLHVELKREVPEQMKPRTIRIETTEPPKVIPATPTQEKAA